MLAQRTVGIQFVTTEYTVADQLRMEKATRYFQWLCRLVSPYVGKRVLEIGCGMGNFTRVLPDRECVVGIDIDEGVLKVHHERFRDREHVAAYRMDSTSSDFSMLERYRPDSVVCLNVLEHIEDDRLALANMQSVLQPGGRAVLIVPAFQSLFGPIDQKLGHYRRYSKSMLRDLAEQTGFRVMRLRYMNLIGFFGWWFNARVSKRTEQSEAQIAVFDSLVVPIQAAIEALIEPPWGQSIFTVLEKQ
jgi:ubiquinone/menaquinone biosynthesis C-methylase UbiE